MRGTEEIFFAFNGDYYGIYGNLIIMFKNAFSVRLIGDLSFRFCYSNIVLINS